jgi:hypothetical protein
MLLLEYVDSSSLCFGHGALGGGSSPVGPRREYEGRIGSKCACFLGLIFLYLMEL